MDQQCEVLNNGTQAHMETIQEPATPSAGTGTTDEKKGLRITKRAAIDHAIKSYRAENNITCEIVETSTDGVYNWLQTNHPELNTRINRYDVAREKSRYGLEMKDKASKAAETKQRRKRRAAKAAEATNPIPSANHEQEPASQMPEISPEPPQMEQYFTLTELQDASEFATRMGGLTRAALVLTTVVELQHAF